MSLYLAHLARRGLFSEVNRFFRGTVTSKVQAMDASGTGMTGNHRGKKILLVDDDQALRTVLAEQLDLYDGFTTIQVGTAAEGLEKAKLTHYDAVLLDIGLPDMDGRELCKLMRRQGVRAPVIMLTAADSDADTLLGLESGANDYGTKPFRATVRLARLRAHLRQHESSEDAVMTIGPYEFHPA